ncbi:enoyl-CoA hydratase [Amycolatopsis acidicola]|uniref:Enoyl-CoA hydratase n=1 Tax=Amycolatopsis acidicola TaxID=2596893 RepID=A0A5N0VLG2_9PSEU|nr:MaoC/PaaZ C-terminal domain-containing protein [Amycolatopsis acidicola]KAA9166020.1 enoyl-CoA hydratase [Amycolatopsis acidicola]
MPLDLAVVGRERPPVKRSWDSAAAILYALGVGAGAADPAAELEFTTETDGDRVQRVLPTFASVLVPGRLSGELGTFDRSRVVHAEEELTLHRPLPAAGDVVIRSRVAGIHDQGSAALVVVEADFDDATDGQTIATVRSGLFFRGEGGFGGARAPKTAWARPERQPDWSSTYQTRPEQALLFRLNGDRNPLHADPGFARRAGFPRPILHGLCTYGFAGRAVLRSFAEGDPGRVTSFAARMSAPVLPGEQLTVNIWQDSPSTAVFQVTKPDGTVVLDRGRAGVRVEEA